MRGDPEAPPLVMFHGNGTMLQDLTISGLVDEAAHKFRVICFDRPEFGHSNRPRERRRIPVIGDALRYTISPISTWLGLPLFAKKTFGPKPVPEIVKKEYPRLMLIRPSQLRWPRTRLSCCRPQLRSRCHTGVSSAPRRSSPAATTRSWTVSRRSGCRRRCRAPP
jgi:hypothetical protein